MQHRTESNCIYYKLLTTQLSGFITLLELMKVLLATCIITQSEVEHKSKIIYQGTKG